MFNWVKVDDLGQLAIFLQAGVGGALCNPV